MRGKRYASAWRCQERILRERAARLPFSGPIDFNLMDALVSLDKNVDFVVILVRPQGARNVGAVARAMSHFGVSTLRIVSPRCDIKSVDARAMAMSAQPLLARARHFASLREASRDCGWLVGTSRRLGRKRQPTMRPREDADALLRRASATRVGLVFGQENKGLFTEELSLCQERLFIPALPDGESFNLSQAVLIVLWELFSANQANLHSQEASEGSRRADAAASREEIEGLVDHLLESMTRIGFVPHNDPDRVARTFRRMLDRLGPDEREVRVMRGIMRQAIWKLLHPEKKERAQNALPPPRADEADGYLPPQTPSASSDYGGETHEIG